MPLLVNYRVFSSKWTFHDAQYCCTSVQTWCVDHYEIHDLKVVNELTNLHSTNQIFRHFYLIPASRCNKSCIELQYAEHEKRTVFKYYLDSPSQGLWTCWRCAWLPFSQATQHKLSNDIHRPPSSMLQFWPILDLPHHQWSAYVLEGRPIPEQKCR